jgi:hypothetical protein
MHAVAFGKLGLTNRRKQVRASRDKCTLLFLNSLGEELRERVIINGTFGMRLAFKFMILLCIWL